MGVNRISMGATMLVTDLALQRKYVRWIGGSEKEWSRFPAPAAIDRARARCAEILEARAKAGGR